MREISLTLLFIYLAVINLAGFIMYAVDKAKAKQKARRIPEKTLLNFARLGGGLGCWLGMKVFRHKTLHKQFRITVPLWTIIWLGFIIFILIK